MNRAAAIILWVSLIMIIFIIILGYTTMSRVYTSGIWEDIENISDVNESEDATSVLSMNQTIWQYWPYLALLAFLMFGVVAMGG